MVILQTHQRQTYSRLILAMILFILSSLNHAQPGLTQQAIEAIPESKTTPSFPSHLNKPGQTEKQRLEALLKWLATPEGKSALKALLKHPFLTSTAKSVYTPAGTPMKWGGIGFSGGAFGSYPSYRHGPNQWIGGGTVALPFGDSDKLIGAAIAVSDFGIPSGPSWNGGSNGNLSLMASRWFGYDTIIIAGIANLAPWGDVFKQAAHSYYGALTQMWGLRLNNTLHPMSASIGVGTGMFSPLGQLTSTGVSKAFQDNHAYPFANLSFNFTPNAAVVGDYYSETFALGLSYNRVIKLPLSFMMFVGNLRHTNKAPGTILGFRVSTGLPLPGKKHK